MDLGNVPDWGVGHEVRHILRSGGICCSLPALLGTPCLDKTPAAGWTLSMRHAGSHGQAAQSF